MLIKIVMATYFTTESVFNPNDTISTAGDHIYVVMQTWPKNLI